MSKELIELNQHNLGEISEQLSSPKYDRSTLQSGIVHIGVGGFHRAHQAYYLHELFNKKEAKDWAITGVGLREYDREMYDALKKQDGLYTLTVQSPDGDVKSEVIGSILEMLLAVDTPYKVLERMADKQTKIISLTITEGGYNFNPNTGEFNFEKEEIKHDLATPDKPVSVFGYLTETFRKRRDNGAGAVTILSCDNVQHNGDVTKKVMMDFTKEQDPDLVPWIEENVAFPNSMVDRITPKTTDETVEYVKSNFGIEDAFPVNCEPFIQWVIEDNFINGRPLFEQVGAQFVDDVKPYEEMKLRLLNAGHSVVGITGALHGYPTIYKCLADDLMAKYLRAYLDKEATPVLAPVEGIDVEEYKDKLIERFGNPNIKDSVSRICEESSAKLPKFILPTIFANLEKDGDVRLGALIIAAWCYYHDKKKNEKGGDLKIIDEMKDQLSDYAKKTSDDPLAFLQQEGIFGNLGNNEAFTKVYAEHIENIYAEEDILKVMGKEL